MRVEISAVFQRFPMTPPLAGQGPPAWFADSGLFHLVVFGSLAGLTLALLALLTIWWVEWRNGRVW
jgi:hypothetical protein